MAGNVLLVGVGRVDVSRYEAAFRRAEMDVTVLPNGRDALHFAKTSEVTLVLASWFLPDINGTAFEIYLRTDPATRHIPVAFVDDEKDADSVLLQLLASGIAAVLDEKAFDRFVFWLRAADTAIAKRRSR